MQTLVDIGPIRAAECGLDLVADLNAIHPSDRSASYAAHGLARDSPELARILARLHAAGLEPRKRDAAFDPKKHFLMALRRRYDQQDLRECEFLQLRGQGKRIEQNLLTHRRDPMGCVRIDRTALPPPRGLVLGFGGGCFLVPDRIRRAIDAAGFAHVAFKSLVVVRDAPMMNPLTFAWDEKKYGERWWELAADLWMPPLSPSADLRKRDGTPLGEKDRRAQPWQDGVGLVEGLHLWPELRYRREDVTRFMPEGWDGAVPLESGMGLVASQRLHRFLEGQGADAEWIPVRIEE